MVNSPLFIPTNVAPGKHKHLGADRPINAVLSKSKMDIKIKQRNFEKKQLLHELPTTKTNLYAELGNNQAINVTTINI